MDPGPIFSIDQTPTSNPVTFCNYSSANTFHSIRLILCFSKTGEIDNLTESLGQSILVVLCAGSTRHLLFLEYIYCLTDDWVSNTHFIACHKSDDASQRTTGVRTNVEPAHNTTKILCPNDSVRLSISPVLLKQRIKRIDWKVIFAEK